MRRRGRTQLYAALRAQSKEAGADIDQPGADGREGQHDDRQRVQPPPERQREHVEADVVAEHRIDLAERHRVPVDEPRLPLGGRDRRHQDGAGGGSHRDDRPQPGRIHDDDARALRRDHDDLAPRQHAKRQPQVERQQAEADGKSRHPQGRLRRQALGVDALIADLREPQPVGIELHARRQQEEDRDEEGEQCETAGRHRRAMSRLYASASPLPRGAAARWARARVSAASFMTVFRLRPVPAFFSAGIFSFESPWPFG